MVGGAHAAGAPWVGGLRDRGHFRVVLPSVAPGRS